jgi:nucleotide-binding universal stress UspA family protein
MTTPILAAYCPQTEDAGPVLFAAAVARGIGAPLEIVAVHSSGTVADVYSGAELADLPRAFAVAALADVRTRLSDDQPVETRALEALSPAAGITQAIEDARPLLAVLGSTTRGPIGRVLPGSTAERVVHGVGCPVAVVPHGYQAPIAGRWTIGAAFIPTDDGREALRTAAALAGATRARLRAISVLNPHIADRQASGMHAQQHHEGGGADDRRGTMVREAEQTMLDELSALQDASGAESEVLLQDAADGLVAASAHLELLVMGSRAYGPLHAVMTGGVSRRVLARASCPVLVLPRGAEQVADSLRQAVAASDSGR